MAGNIFYKREAIWTASSTRFDNLSEKLLSIAYKKAIDPYSALVQFMKVLEHNTWGFIDKDLNSKEEVWEFAELLELAIQEWIQEGFYDYYNYKENGKIKNRVIDEYKNFAKRLREIATDKWKDENLLINRAYKLKPLSKTLLYWAKKKRLKPRSPLMQFLETLSQEQLFKDISIYTKEDLAQFVELLELSIKTLIDEDYFFEHEEYYFLNYLQRLKEMVQDWDNAISEEWKQRGVIAEEKKAYQKQCAIIKQLETSIIIRMIKYISFLFALFFIVILIVMLVGILIFLTLIIQDFLF